MESTGNCCGFHALVVPLPGQGHINPMMQLAKKLASMGISITFVLTNSWHQIITDAHLGHGVDAFAHARNLGLNIRMVAIPDCVPGEFERWSKIQQFYGSLGNMEGPVEELIHDLHRQPNVTPVSCIVADTYLTWAVPLAKKLNMLSISFWTQSISMFSILHHSELVHRQAGSVIHVPGEISIQPAELGSFLKDPANTRAVVQCLQRAREADWVVANSFQALEGDVVEALSEKLQVYCVGPLLPSAYLDHSVSRDFVVGTSSRVEIDCTKWLDDQRPKSVIYVSFGSLIPVSARQVEELAMGLKESSYCFMWVLRHPGPEATEVSAMLPDGFLKETKERGLIVPWCSQLKVLNHPSIGGFLSHCGWNSVLESISSGIPLLGFPLGNDQYTNCRLLADERKIGLRLKSSNDTEKVVGREEIAEKVRRLMEGEELRRTAERLRDVVQMEVKNGGTSNKNLEIVANGLKTKLR
eukprot:PITA_36154